MSEQTRNDNPQDAARTAARATFNNWERETLERLVFATVREQRASRRWSIFFKLSFLVLAFVAIWAYFDFNFGSSDIESLGRHTALIEIDGAIEAEGSGSAETVIPSLNKAFADPGSAAVCPAHRQPRRQPGPGRHHRRRNPAHEKAVSEQAAVCRRRRDLRLGRVLHCRSRGQDLSSTRPASSARSAC
jgi:hypothetical protein